MCSALAVKDEPVLADGELLYVGQPVVVIAAESLDAIRAAKEAIKIHASPVEPILSIERAIELGRFLGPARRIASGDADKAIAAAPHRLSGVFQSLGQEQFYLESQAAIAYPGEAGQMVVHSSTQNPTEIQVVVAEMLGIGQHQVVCICKRMGGGFGGKETQAAIPAMLAALVAHKTGRAARIIYDKDEDMISTGKRHPYRNEWEVGFDDTGRILGLKTQFYSNGGALDGSVAGGDGADHAPRRKRVLHRRRRHSRPRVLHELPVEHGVPRLRRTAGHGGDGKHHRRNCPAFGARPARSAAAQSLRHRRAQRHALWPGASTAITCRRLSIGSSHRPTMEAAEKKSKLQNATDRLRLRGIALSPVKFGISFITRFMNQASALVNVYTDGTIQVSTGGTEMGQGLNTKIRQLVADEFGIAWERVLVMPTSTEKNANTSPTAASAGTDLNGAAALNACRQIKSRLAEFAVRHFAGTDRNPKASP